MLNGEIALIFFTIFSSISVPLVVMPISMPSFLPLLKILKMSFRKKGSPPEMLSMNVPFFAHSSTNPWSSVKADINPYGRAQALRPAAHPLIPKKEEES